MLQIVITQTIVSIVLYKDYIVPDL